MKGIESMLKKRLGSKEVKESSHVLLFAPLQMCVSKMEKIYKEGKDKDTTDCLGQFVSTCCSG